MVAESDDEVDMDMEAIQLPPSLFDSVMIRMVEEESGEVMTTGRRAAGWVRAAPKAKRPRRGGMEREAELEAKLQAALAEVRRLKLEPRAAQGEAITRLAVVEADRTNEYRNNKSNLMKKEARCVEKIAEGLKERGSRIHELTKQVKRLTKEIATTTGQLEKQQEIKLRLREQMKAGVSVEVHTELHDQYESQLIEVTRLRDSIGEYDDEVAELNDKQEELQQEIIEMQAELADATAGPGKGKFANAHAHEHLKKIKEEIGLKLKSMSVPARSKPDVANSEWSKLSIRHVTAVLKGRGEGDDIEMIAEALHRCGGLRCEAVPCDAAAALSVPGQRSRYTAT